jgi:hypothetical protein
MPGVASPHNAHKYGVSEDNERIYGMKMAFMWDDAICQRYQAAWQPSRGKYQWASPGRYLVARCQPAALAEISAKAWRK